MPDDDLSAWLLERVKEDERVARGADTVPVRRDLLRAIEKARRNVFLASDAAGPGLLLQLNDMLRQLPDADA